MPCFASSLLDSNRRQRALQISAGPIGQGDYYQPVSCLVLLLVYELEAELNTRGGGSVYRKIVPRQSFAKICLKNNYMWLKVHKYGL